jgi:hypothetical protein
MARFLRRCGIHMGHGGEETNTVTDALAFVDMLDKYVNAVLNVTRGTNYDAFELPPLLRKEIVRAYRTAAQQHRRDLQKNEKWGFKNPRHIFLLPLLNLAFPGVVFIHLVRDGRDMLFSENKHQVRAHFEPLLGQPVDESLDSVARFWSGTNLGAKVFGETQLGARYINVRIEDLCGSERDKHIGRLAKALGLDIDLALFRAEKFELRESYGRGRSARLELSPAVGKEFFDALAAFNYSTAG